METNTDDWERITPAERRRRLYSDDPAVRFQAVVDMATGHARDAMNPATYWVCAATISRARRDFYGMIVEQGLRLH